MHSTLLEKQRLANFGPPTAPGPVHCTPCRPYCYATVVIE